MITVPVMGKEHEMTMDDIYAKLRSKLTEEMTDSDVYCEMAKCAEEHGKDALAFGLWLMSADEQSHKDFIQQYLDKEHD